MTDYASIERWWEIVMSAYLLVSLQANYFRNEAVLKAKAETTDPSTFQLSNHCHWEKGTTWKSSLNNLRLILQPYIFYCLMQPWLNIFKISKFRRCFLELIEEMNHFLGGATLSFSGFCTFHFMTG